MNTLYAFINQEQYKIWSATVDQPCVEQFLREIGTTKIPISRNKKDEIIKIIESI